LAILLRSFGLFAPKDVCIILLSIFSCCYERTRWMLLQKRVVSTKLDIMLSLLATTNFTFNSRLLNRKDFFVSSVLSFIQSYPLVWSAKSWNDIDSNVGRYINVDSTLKWRFVSAGKFRETCEYNDLCVVCLYLCGYFIVFCFVLRLSELFLYSTSNGLHTANLYNRNMLSLYGTRPCIVM